MLMRDHNRCEFLPSGQAHHQDFRFVQWIGIHIKELVYGNFVVSTDVQSPITLRDYHQRSCSVALSDFLNHPGLFQSVQLLLQ